MSRTPRKIGRVIYENLLNNFERLYAVNPNAEEILGKKSYASVKDINEEIDLAVIAVPAAHVSKALQECVEKGVKAVIIISAGFSEIGRDEKELLDIAGGKLRIIGPNVLGVYDAYSRVDTIFNISYRQERPPKGSIAFISQSGAFAATLMDWLAEEGIGLSKFVSIGNRADVDESDMLDYLMYDEKTKVIAVYLEGVKDGRRFYEKLREAAGKKPVVVLKAGKTAAGETAARSHTGSLAGSAKVFSGVLRQARAIEAKSIEELFDFSKAFMQPLPSGSNVQIITNGGGFGVLTADAVVENNLALAKFSRKVEEQLKEKMPDYVIISNPIDLTGDSDALRYKAALGSVAEDKNIDAIIVILLMQVSSLESNVIEEIIEAKRYGKPIFVCSTGSDFTEIHKKILEENGIPVYPTPERAAKAMHALVTYARTKVEKN